MVKIKIFIQSVSDLITNSSSEVFCRISSETSIGEIYNFLNPLFNEGFSEDVPSINKCSLEEEKEYLSIESIKKLSNEYIEIDLPYRLSECSEFFRAGLEAILDKYFKDYTIEYVD